ncbi:MAG TPA: type 1 glutamine amidotransferase domain-containing protein [Nocardia sp.]|uniref:type 1 glutamine amidotransferase domain-containing protein n=1 Tax=Nocardia TaxID=1817 RepID=UPI002454B8DE|nr:MULTISPECIES: type 1 glutamine amidotransferase domain-containing protein [Nocardia]HLS78150.1 type 1 glutamine amidotransferase domain-containing protein [Nocardia sp.]
MAKILFLMSAADHWTLADGTKHPTGYWAEEFTAPYETFTAAGHEVEVATPGGVTPTVDRASLAEDAAGGAEAVRRIERVLDSAEPLRHPRALGDLDLADYTAVFVPGGHGPMEDLAVDAEAGRLLGDVVRAGLPLGVVCHGPAALLATGGDQESPFRGYRVTAFSNAEERQAGLADRAPWLLADRLTELGVDYREGPPWEAHVEVDRTLYTGQNPASAGPLAERMLAALG